MKNLTERKHKAETGCVKSLVSGDQGVARQGGTSPQSGLNAISAAASLGIGYGLHKWFLISGLFNFICRVRKGDFIHEKEEPEHEMLTACLSDNMVGVNCWS
ncbi:hypothetical protein, partial [Nitrosovibrio tenuis]|uniref:hypothetical protein n=1 Tax=Nitrosovibrio tenuis TaxID=1233 RepID=UPI0015A5FA49